MARAPAADPSVQTEAKQTQAISALTLQFLLFAACVGGGGAWLILRRASNSQATKNARARAGSYFSILFRCSATAIKL